jgi:uncharacterized protein YndB with AHSA1/START domain
VEVVRSVEIARPVEDVFAFVADARNDPRWCPKVRSVEQVDGDRYAVVHKPVPGKPERRMDMTRVSMEPPRRIEWLEEDGVDVFRVSYELEATAGGTRLTQRSSAELGSSRLLRPLYKAGIGRDVARQLKELKKLLEA